LSSGVLHGDLEKFHRRGDDDLAETSASSRQHLSLNTEFSIFIGKSMTEEVVGDEFDDLFRCDQQKVDTRSSVHSTKPLSLTCLGETIPHRFVHSFSIGSSLLILQSSFDKIYRKYAGYSDEACYRCIDNLRKELKLLVHSMAWIRS